MYFQDQTNYQIILSDRPKRIISLVPSQTELLYDLGLEKEVVGITKFCVHPRLWFDTKEKIGGTKKLNIDRIISLKPDLIIGNKEENTKEQIEKLRKKFPVWLSDINSLEEALGMIRAVGELTQTQTKAEFLIEKIESKKGAIPQNENRVLYFIWNKPMMVVGQETFINSMLHEAGMVNVMQQNRYPEVGWEEIKRLEPQTILLSTEPFPFAQKHLDLFRQKMPNSRIEFVNGELFSWYGSRLLKSFDYFRTLNAKFLQ